MKYENTLVQILTCQAREKAAAINKNSERPLLEA